MVLGPLAWLAGRRARKKPSPHVRLEVWAMTVDGRRVLYAMDCDVAADLQAFGGRPLRIGTYEISLKRIER